MPPIKGRMMSRMGGPVHTGGMHVKNIIKKVPTPKKRTKTCPIRSQVPLPDNIVEDEKLMKLRMPTDLVRILPSVKKYKGGKDFVDLTDNGSNSGESLRSDMLAEEDGTSVTSGGETKQIIGVKRGRGSQNKYVMKLLAEERFCSMIWSVNISPTGEIYVSCCEGVFICDNELDKKSKLDKIVLPGGVTFFPDGQVIVLCRNSDTVNFFTKDGIFIKSFAAGFSPMDLILQGKDTLVISDPGEQCVHIFDTKGTELHKIPTTGKGYKFEWPLYLTSVDEQCFLVSDCHAQKVSKFKNSGKFVSTYGLKTVGSNCVLRPHGVSTFRTDIFVIDSSMDTIEAFSEDDMFTQTVIPREDGLSLKPKCMDVDSSKGLFVIGGRSGVVRVYEFLDTEYYDFQKGENVEFKIKCDSIKREIKSEPEFRVKEEEEENEEINEIENSDEENEEHSNDSTKADENDDVILLD